MSKTSEKLPRVNGPLGCNKLTPKKYSKCFDIGHQSKWITQSMDSRTEGHVAQLITVQT